MNMNRRYGTIFFLHIAPLHLSSRTEDYIVWLVVEAYTIVLVHLARRRDFVKIEEMLSFLRHFFLSSLS